MAITSLQVKNILNYFSFKSIVPMIHVNPAQIGSISDPDPLFYPFRAKNTPLSRADPPAATAFHLPSNRSGDTFI